MNENGAIGTQLRERLDSGEPLIARVIANEYRCSPSLLGGVRTLMIREGYKFESLMDPYGAKGAGRFGKQMRWIRATHDAKGKKLPEKKIPRIDFSEYDPPSGSKSLARTSGRNAGRNGDVEYDEMGQAPKKGPQPTLGDTLRVAQMSLDDEGDIVVGLESSDGRHVWTAYFGGKRRAVNAGRSQRAAGTRTGSRV